MTTELISNSTWKNLNNKCSITGQTLCSAKDVCGTGKFIDGVKSGQDAWLAVNDKVNEWIQIGNSVRPECLVHSSLGSGPNWGLNKGFGSTYVKCCGEPKPYKKQITKPYEYSEKTSWEDMNKKCTIAGGKLCSSKDVCQIDNNLDGKFIDGVKKGEDAWMAVGDKPREWVQIGNTPISECTLHSNIPGGAQLGLSPDYKNTYFKCCYGDELTPDKKADDDKKAEDEKKTADNKKAEDEKKIADEKKNIDEKKNMDNDMNNNKSADEKKTADDKKAAEEKNNGTSEKTSGTTNNAPSATENDPKKVAVRSTGLSIGIIVLIIIVACICIMCCAVLIFPLISSTLLGIGVVKNAQMIKKGFGNTSDFINSIANKVGILKK